ncbi:type II toxin-antitoxin system YafQ family toxin [Puniceicoccus vermicola]|uniref:Type II toxin-antitoxin system YafQ family toxin n=1 Tax=Puniceicoccus vermicola TaxID=388746 RepID=A0A7X1AZS8_9BACT|nr:type II toxin-antitoxin system YafQ family toxin [Puniceicoccus vermicola]MBC2602995.1 type II toxin-antitoxin system YafQ family toxin [Puniceicoccus vermicola]
MLRLVRKSRFKKDFKKLLSSGKDLEKLGSVIMALQAEESLPKHNRDHALTGNYAGHRECHLEPDWLLVYKVEEGQLILVRTGSHSELFG